MFDLEDSFITEDLGSMVYQMKKSKSRVIPPKQASKYPTIELGQVQELRLLQSYVEGCIGRVTVALGLFLRQAGVARVELVDLALSELSLAEQESWVWCAGATSLDNRMCKMFQVGMPRSAASIMTTMALGLTPTALPESHASSAPSETELRFLNRMNDVVKQEIVAENTSLQGVHWLHQPTGLPEKKGLCLTLRLVFEEKIHNLIIYWHTAFAELLESVSGHSQDDLPITREQLESTLEKIPVQLKAVLLSTKLRVSELELLLQGEILPVALLERVPLGCGNFTMGFGQLYDRKGHLVFQLHNDASQRQS